MRNRCFGRMSFGRIWTLSACQRGLRRDVQVDGKFADAVLGEFNGTPRYVVALEGKGPKDPLDRPFAGRRMSAVDQGYRYAINLQCDWVIVTSIRQIRLYYKGCDTEHEKNHDPSGFLLLRRESEAPPQNP